MRERNYQKNGIINVALLATAAIALFGTSRYIHSFSGMIASAFAAAGFLASVVSWFQMGLEARESAEKLETEEMARTAAGSALFESTSSELLPARRTREQFERFFVPVFSILLMLGLGAGAFFLWRWLDRAVPSAIQQPMVGLSTYGFFALVLFLVGKYAAGLVRLENLRLLRPGANMVLFCAYLCALLLGTLAFVQGGFERADLWVARALVILLGILALELLVQLVLEIYRPRVKGQRARVLYDSRLSGLLGQPESLFTTAAHALDYQFGFKVSETWFYQFLQKSIAWLLLIQVGALLLSTSLVFINAGEGAVLERFGRAVAGREVLGPGAHLKWPWPIERAYRFNTDHVQSFNVGFVADEEPRKTISWTEAHYKEEYNMLVATRGTDAPAASPGETPAKNAPPVNLLSVSIPVHYQITNLQAWVYHHTDAGKVLENAASREVVRFLASADMHELMSVGRTAAAAELQQRIQAAANTLGLGVRVVFVGLKDIHPPRDVASKYEDVVGAHQKSEATLLSAQSDALGAVTTSIIESNRLTQINVARSFQITNDAQLKAFQFTNQLPVAKAAPSVYPLWLYLKSVEKVAPLPRKYLVLSTNREEVLTLNLEERFNPLIDAAAQLPPKKKSEEKK